MTSPANRLRELLGQERIQVMPCCYDALSAKLIQRAGFELTFMSGFAVSAARLGLPDTGLISYGEMVDQARLIGEAIDLPIIADGDTGYGNPMSVRRTVRGYAKAGMAGIMIEDQLSPKRCGHTQGKQVVGRDEAERRVRAAVDAREEGADILIMARTDARGPLGLEEAIIRCQRFRELGADITFLEAPQSEAEMRAYCEAVSGPKMANMVEQGVTPLLPPEHLQEIGYAIVAYPLTLLSASVRIMEEALGSLKNGRAFEGGCTFKHLQAVVGFDDHDRQAERYKE